VACERGVRCGRLASAPSLLASDLGFNTEKTPPAGYHEAAWYPGHHAAGASCKGIMQPGCCQHSALRGYPLEGMTS